MTKKHLYKFLRLTNGKIKSESGNHVWTIGEWYKHDGEVKACSVGFHASEKIIDAFSYVNGEVLAKVEVKGVSDIESDKQCWSEMKIVKAWGWEKKDSVALSIYSAQLCLKNFERLYPKDDRPRKAIEAAIAWAKNPTEENRLAAESAAESARSAAESAAWSARSAAWSARSAAWSARSAAESAAESAAWSARSAAWSARSAAEKINAKIEKWLVAHIKEMTQIK